MKNMMNLIATIVAVIIAMVMLSGCSEFGADYDEAEPQNPVVNSTPVYYWQNKENPKNMDLYDAKKKLIGTVAFGGYTLTAETPFSHIGNSGVELLTKTYTLNGDCECTVKYKAGGKDYSFKVTFKGYNQKHKDYTLKPLYDLSLAFTLTTNVPDNKDTSYFYEESVVTTELFGSDDIDHELASAKTDIKVSEKVIPINVTVIEKDDNGNNAVVNFNNGDTAKIKIDFKITAGTEFEEQGSVGLTPEKNLRKDGQPENGYVDFTYTYGESSFTDGVAVEGTNFYIYYYEEEEYKLKFTNKFFVKCNWQIEASSYKGYSFYEKSKGVYTLGAVTIEEKKDINLDSDASSFIIYMKKADEPADPKPLYWYQDVEKMIVVYDDNSTEDKDNKISASTEDKSWTGDKDLEMTGNTSKPASKTMYFSTNYGDIKVNLSALIALGGDIDYDGHTIPCKSEFIVEAGTPVLVSNGKEGFDYHKVFNVPVVVKTKTNEEIKEVASCTSKVTISKKTEVPTLVETIVNYIHKHFRAPIVDKQNITIICDNSAVFTDVMSDKSEVKAGEVPYTTTYNFGLNGNLNFIAGSINEVANQGGYFANGAFTLQGRNFSVTEVSSEVSEVSFRNKDYSAPMCVVTPYMWKTNDKGDTLTITFVDENGTPCATANIAMKVKVTTIVPKGKLYVVTSYYGHGPQDKIFTKALDAVIIECTDGRVYAFDIEKGVNSGFYTTPTTIADKVKNFTYALVEDNNLNWVLGKVDVLKLDGEGDNNRLVYYDLKGNTALALGFGESSPKGAYPNPIIIDGKETSEGVDVTVNDKTYHFASQN